MAILNDVIRLDGQRGFPDLGSLLGTSVSSEVFERINSNPHQSFFGDELLAMRQDFYNTHVTPAQQLEHEMARTFQQIGQTDHIRALTTIEDFRTIPRSMEMVILLHEPVRRLFEQGRIEGFGYDPRQLPEEDIYGRLLNNFHVENVASVADDDGVFELKATFRSDDPFFDLDELDAMRETRNYVMDKILAETSRDPTDIDSMRG